MAQFTATELQRKRICETANELRVWGLSKEEVRAAIELAVTDEIMFGFFLAWSEAGKDEKDRLAHIVVKEVGSRKPL